MSDRYRLIERKDLDCTDWDSFADSSTDAWLWHRSETLNALDTWYGSQDCSFAISDVEDKNQIVAILPLRRITRRAGGLVKVYILDSFGGPALNDFLTKKSRRKVLSVITERLQREVVKNACLEVRVLLSPMTPCLRGESCPRVNPLVNLGFENTLTQTWVVDLRCSQDDLWGRMEGRARTAVRKAEKAGVVVREAHSSDLEVYYRLHVETYHRTGANPHPFSYFESIWRDFVSKNLAKVWVAEFQGEAIAAENFGLYKNAGLYWTGAATQLGLKLEANSLLQWHAMQWMVGAGIEWYETGEAFPGVAEGKLRGLNDFKRSFGGELYPYYKGVLRAKGMFGLLYKIIQ